MNLQKESNEAAPYEAATRRQKQWSTVAPTTLKLPIKRPTGEWVYDVTSTTTKKGKQNAINNRMEEENKHEQKKTHQNGEMAALKEKIPKTKKEEPKQVLRLRADDVTRIIESHMTYKTKRQLIAETGQKILANPEESLQYIEILFQLLEDSEKVMRNEKGNNGSSVDTQKQTKDAVKEAASIYHLTLVSLGITIKDLFSSYDGDIEAKGIGTATLSKEKVKEKQFEKSLGKYIRRLLTILKDRIRREQDTVVPIACQLLRSGIDSEFAEELIELCIHNSEDRRSLDPISLTNDMNNQNVEKKGDRSFNAAEKYAKLDELRCETLEDIINRDPTLKTAVKVVKAIGNAAKIAHINRQKRKNQQGCFLRERLLNVVINLDKKINKVLAEGEDIKIKGKTTKETKELMKDIRKGNIQDDKSVISKHERTILNELFVIYIRVLSSWNRYSEGVVEASLRGISSLGHLVNVELVYELFNELQLLLVEEKALTPLIGIAAIEACLTLLSCAKDALKVDKSWIPEAFGQLLQRSIALFGCGCISMRRGGSIGAEIQHFSNPNNPDLPSGSTSTSVVKRCEFARRSLRTLDRMLNDVDFFGTKTATHNVELLLQLTKGLLSVAAHSDIFVCYGFVLEIQKMMERHPKLKGSIGLDGAIISCLCESVTYFWQLEVFGCHVCPSIRQLYSSIISSSLDSELIERLQKEKSKLGFLPNGNNHHYPLLLAHEDSRTNKGKSSNWHNTSVSTSISAIPPQNLTGLDFYECCIQPSSKLLLPSILEEADSGLSKEFFFQNGEFMASSTKEAAAIHRRKASLVEQKLRAPSLCCTELLNT